MSSWVMVIAVYFLGIVSCWAAAFYYKKCVVHKDWEEELERDGRVSLIIILSFGSWVLLIAILYLIAVKFLLNVIDKEEDDE